MKHNRLCPKCENYDHTARCICGEEDDQPDDAPKAPVARPFQSTGIVRREMSQRGREWAGMDGYRDARE